VPAAARWPVEVHLYPHRRVPGLDGLGRAERAAFGPIYTEVLRRLDGLFGVAMPYVSAWHQAPVRVDRDLAYTHLELFSIRRAPDKLKYLAGSESAMGAFVNDVPPEETAQRLRAVVTE
ncbi:galactose-1-phosphate uridylyltransferase, partial [Streptosporangium algeriense]